MWQEQGEPGGSSPAAGRRGRPTGSRRAGRQFGFYSEGSGESWKPERTQSDPSGRRRESAREAGLSVRTLLAGHTAGLDFSSHHSPPSAGLPCVVNDCPIPIRGPATWGSTTKALLTPRIGREEGGGWCGKGGLARVCSRLTLPRASLSLSLQPTTPSLRGSQDGGGGEPL